MPDHHDHDINRVELSGVLHKPPIRGEYWTACELKIGEAGGKVLFMRLHINHTMAEVLDGVPLGTRLHVQGRLAFARVEGGRHLVNVQELHLLPAGVTLSRGR